MTVAGIDVAKDKLDVVISGLKAFKVAYGEAGLVRLVARLKEQGVSLEVMEASGGYERGAEKALRHASTPVAVVNPTWIRNCVRSYVHLEKTGIIEAFVLEGYARERAPEPTPPLADEQLRRKALERRRDQLKQEVVREVNRRKPPPSSS